MFNLLTSCFRALSKGTRKSLKMQSFVPRLEGLEDRQLLSGSPGLVGFSGPTLRPALVSSQLVSGSPVLTDSSGDLFKLGNDHELYYSAPGSGTWQQLGGPYTAIAGDAKQDVLALGVDHHLYNCTLNGTTSVASGVSGLAASRRAEPRCRSSNCPSSVGSLPNLSWASA